MAEAAEEPAGEADEEGAEMRNVLKNFRFAFQDGPAVQGDLLVTRMDMVTRYDAVGVNDNTCEVTIRGVIIRPSFEEQVALELMEQP